MYIETYLKSCFPGIANQALEEILRTSMNLHSNRRVNNVLHRTGISGEIQNAKEAVARSTAYLCGLVKAYYDAGWIPEFCPPCGSFCTTNGSMKNEYSSFDVEEVVEFLRTTVDAWLAGEL